MFQLTRVSLLWHTVLASTSRMLPLPGLTHASKTAAELVASLTMGTAASSKANATSPPMTVRRIQILVMFFLLF
jgi:hypothetical protein